ncbi:copper amine oxidase N-terminal domain-containing protein [Gorillibacterium timonense]|uniref:copper amine oxidase N-terminal domain-containing protein n=1 Tax=Gorillibacterium timonense TaxID=1689269 RepID=UPI00071C858F|nr:copper amine oxidase N-terminal domain-containing protein [Gorillibacterium timonense]
MKLSKRSLVLSLLICLLIFIPVLPQADAAGERPIKIIINGTAQTFDTPARLVNGSVLVPMRSIFEKLKATVNWDNANQRVTATKDFTNIQLTIGSKTAHVNNKSVSLSTAPQLLNGSTMVPLRFISEAMDADVKWNSSANTVTITYSSKWEQLPKPKVTAITSVAWSPDGLLTIGTNEGIQQYASGNWESFGGAGSPVSNRFVKDLKWSEDGKLVAVVQEENKLDYLWMYEKGIWSKIPLPQATSSLGGQPIKAAVFSDDLWYLNWTSDGALTASFGSWKYGVNFGGLWQYRDHQWTQLPGSDQAGTISDVVIQSDSWYMINSNHEAWRYSNGQAQPLKGAGIKLDRLFVQGDSVYGVGESFGAYKLAGDSWVKATGTPYDDLQNTQIRGSRVSAVGAAVSLSGSKMNSLWLSASALWAKLDESAEPFVTGPQNAPIPDSWKKRIEEGGKSTTTDTTCYKGKCETTKGSKTYSIFTKFSEGAFIEQIHLSSSGKSLFLATYKNLELTYKNPMTKKDEMIDYVEAPLQFWIYKGAFNP